jgi:hypothetical protein
VGVGDGVSLGGTVFAVGGTVDVLVFVAVGDGVSVGTGVTVANSMVTSGKGGVLVATFGTHNLCPVNMVVE